MRRSGLWLAVLIAWPALAQLPASFRAEVARIEALLISAPDKAAVTYLMARTWASAQQWHEAMAWLEKAVDLNAGFDPSRDTLFAGLRDDPGFQKIVAQVRDSTPPIGHSSVAYTVAEGDLVPESMAFHAKTHSFFFGSMSKQKVVRCRMEGTCATFADGLGVVLGLKVSGSSLWVLSNEKSRSAVLVYDLDSARVLHTYEVGGAGHLFNDLTISASGDAYISDTRAAAVWRLLNGAIALEKIAGDFPAANGIALSDNGKLMYVSTFPDGIRVVNLKTGTQSPIAIPVGLSLANIDGLYFHRGALIAIQNGLMTPRVARFALSRSLLGIESFEVLERRNPAFDGVTTGVIAGEDFFYMANIQDDRKSEFAPIRVLKLRLR